jgi:T4 RnlA family RNA ligase
VYLGLDRESNFPLIFNDKIINVNEKLSTKAETVDWSKVVRVMDKRDGSMIHTVKAGNGVVPVEGGNFALKSKKSFSSDVAVQATAWMEETSICPINELSPFRYEEFVPFCNFCTANHMTAIFEWTSPVARIVLPYSEPRLTLLHVRDNQTGRYMPLDWLKKQVEVFNITLVDNVDMVQELLKKGFDGFKELFELSQTMPDIEGWVIQFENGDMVKMKTAWYMERHRAMTFLRERDIAGMVLVEGIDDLKAMLVGDGVDVSEIVKIENEVVERLNLMRSTVDQMYEADKALDRKTFAMKHHGFEYFKLLMDKYSGKEPDVIHFYTRNYLDLWSLNQINLLNSVAEVE